MSEIYSLRLSSGKHYPYQLVYSSRAQYIRIKLTSKGKLSVTLPRAATAQKAHDFIKEKCEWVERKLQETMCSPAVKRPEVLNLKLLNESWKINYVPHMLNSIELSEKMDQSLIIHYPNNIQQSDVSGIDKEIESLLINWLKKKAHNVFPSMLQELAECHGFHYRRLSIRAQKTRWGSCSQDKNINLNCKLLFMPESVVNYVMIHELCHTIEMNHSSCFWALVADCDPLFKKHKQLLKISEKALEL